MADQAAMQRANAILAADPEFQQLAQSWRDEQKRTNGRGAGSPAMQAAAIGMQRRAEALGAKVPGTIVGVDGLREDHSTRNLILGTAGVLGGGLAAGALLGGGAAAAGGGAATTGAAGIPGATLLPAGGIGTSAGAAGAAGAAAPAAAAGLGSTVVKNLPALLSGAGTVLGNAAGGQADAQKSAAELEQERARTLANQYGTQQGAETSAGQLNLDRQKFNETSEAARLKRAIIGNLLGNVQDTSISLPGITPATVTGGLRPSALGQGGRDASAEMVARALEQVRAGNTYSGGTVLPQPDVAPVGAQGGSKGLNTAALIASLFGAGAAGVNAARK